MTTATPTEARQWPCPLARARAGGEGDGRCIVDACPVWRWVPLPANDPRFKAAIQQAQKDQQIDHKKAVEYVMKHRAELGLPTAPEVGFCGVGGEVRA